MDPITLIKEKLARHPELGYAATATSLVVEAPSAEGFKVSLQVFGNECIVHFDGWHEHFNSTEEALNCFAFGLSGRARLAITYRGTTPVKWVLEHRVGDEWVKESETGRILAASSEPTQLVYRRNPDLLEPDA
jgi:hypothetical protein